MPPEHCLEIENKLDFNNSRLVCKVGGGGEGEGRGDEELRQSVKTFQTYSVDYN